MGNGCSIKVWGDSWLPMPYPFQVSTANPFLSHSMEVKNLIDAKGGVWLARDVESILSIPLVPSLSNDRLVWHYAKDGILIKTIYHLGMELVECKESWTQALATSNKVLKILWHCTTSTKIHNFI